MDLAGLLDQLEELVNDGFKIPFCPKVVIDQDRVLGIIESIREVLPEEIKQAQAIREERNRILLEAQRQADLMIEETEEHIKNLVDQNEITKKAYQQAEEIIENAKKNAREIRLGTKEYADNLLAELEKRLKEYLDLIAKNREEIKNMRS